MLSKAYSALFMTHNGYSLRRSIPVRGELILTRYRPVSALFENPVTRPFTVVIGAAFATDTLRQTAK